MDTKWIIRKTKGHHIAEQKLRGRHCEVQQVLPSFSHLLRRSNSLAVQNTGAGFLFFAVKLLLEVASAYFTYLTHKATAASRNDEYHRLY